MIRYNKINLTLRFLKYVIYSFVLNIILPLKLGDAGTNTAICNRLTRSRSHVLRIGSNVKLQPYWRELGPWGEADLGPTQASY